MQTLQQRVLLAEFMVCDGVVNGTRGVLLSVEKPPRHAHQG